MKKKLRLAILYGGRSAEHEISLLSARNVIAAVNREKYEVIPILISKEGRWFAGVEPGEEGKKKAIGGVPRGGVEVLPVATPGGPGPLIPVARQDPSIHLTPIDVVFPVLHGTFGEDGTVQGLLEMAGIPCVGAGVLASAVSMDKEVMKRLFHERKLPIAPYIPLLRRDVHLNPRRVCLTVEEKLRYPLFVKPANMGSSVGISKAGNRKELEKALLAAAEYDRKVLVEKAIIGRELECGVLGNDDPIASTPGEIKPGNPFYDYAAKYLDNNSECIVPAPLKPTQIKRVRKLSIEAYRAVDCAGMGRVDLLLEKKTGRLFVNEINTIPGFTDISMYPRMWEESGLAYPLLIDRLVELAIKRHREKARTLYSLNPGKTSSRARA